MNEGRRAEELFIVRLWRESGPGSRAGWRGWVEHVASQERFYFASLADLGDFVSLRLHASDEPESA